LAAGFYGERVAQKPQGGHACEVAEYPRALIKSLTNGLDRITPARLYLLFVVAALIVAHGFFPQTFVVDAITLGLVGISVVIALVPLLESARFAGAEIRMRENLNELKNLSGRAVEELSDNVSEGPPSHTQVMEEAPAAVSNEYETTATSRIELTGTAEAQLEMDDSTADQIVAEILQEASRSPIVGLISLSGQMEQAVRSLLATNDGGGRRYYVTLKAGVGRLVEKGLLTKSAASALSLFSTVRTEIVHGVKRASDDEVLRALDAGIPLFKAIMAIPRERHFVVRGNVPLFSDPDCEQQLIGVSGVIVESRSSGAGLITRRIFPTTRTDFLPRKELTWEWGSKPGWGETWYRDPDSKEIKKAWDGSTEFMGQHLEDDQPRF
jgi:hypothetical protein